MRAFAAPRWRPAPPSGHALRNRQAREDAAPRRDLGGSNGKASANSPRPGDPFTRGRYRGIEVSQRDILPKTAHRATFKPAVIHEFETLEAQRRAPDEYMEPKSCTFGQN